MIINFNIIYIVEREINEKRNNNCVIKVLLDNVVWH